MRNTELAGNTALSRSFSSLALSRSWPNGFSMTTRRHGRAPPLGDCSGGSARPERLSC